MNYELIEHKLISKIYRLERELLAYYGVYKRQEELLESREEELCFRACDLAYSILKMVNPINPKEEAYNKGYNDGIAANLADLEKEFQRGYDFAKKEMAEQKGKADKLPRYYGD